MIVVNTKVGQFKLLINNIPKDQNVIKSIRDILLTAR